MAISKQTLTIGRYLLDRLQHLGVDHIFGLPGDYVLRFDKLIEEHTIKFINTTRENTAGYIADAYARFRGLGVACITYGVGINITNALSQAYVENSPFVVISGTAGTGELLKGQKLHHLINKSSNTILDTTQLEIFKHLTIDQAVLDNPATAAASIDRVLEACQRYKRPVYIEIPRNMVDVEIPPHHPQSYFHPASDPEALQEAMEEVSNILRSCRRPVIWAGHEIQRYGLAPLLIKFAERYGIPIATTLLGKTVISENHPLFVGVYFGGMSRPEVQEFVESCDCALILGAIISDVDTGIFTATFDQDQKIIATSETLDISHHHYKKVLFSDFIHGLSNLNLDVRYKINYPANVKRKKPLFQAVPDQKTTTLRFFECIESHLSSEHIVAVDIGDCLFGSADLTLEQNSYLACAYFGSLGFGVPGAIGAQFALPNKRVIAIVGDGAFQMTCMELSTAVRYGLDPIIIVLNNHGYGTERPLLEGKYNDIVNWNYAEIPRVLGNGLGVRVETEEELDRALKNALSQRGKFHLIEVELGKTDFSPALRRFSEIQSKRAP